jgi:geranylgeranyl diphosphate synthase type I
MDLEEILKERAKIFDRALTGNLSPREPEVFYDALRWIPLSGGKRLRPILAMLSCEAVGGVPETTIPFGISLEYLHNSTLIHDDIAILAGDALIGETYRMLSYMAPPELKSVTYKEIIRSIADAAKNFYEGEALDIEFAVRSDVTIPQYMNMIEKKTAQLYLLAGKGGALIGKGNSKQVENMAQYGTLFGLMFQIKDDLLNILTEQIILGKQMIGSDILNGKRTLMLIHALSVLEENDKSRMMTVVGDENSNQDDVLEVIDLFKTYGSIDYAQNKLAEFRERAKSCLDIVDSSESKDLLIALADYSVTRLY